MFKLKEHQTTPAVEISAGITTFCAMVYILAVNPAILSGLGVPTAAIFTVTALAAILGCLVMAMVANLPFCIAPGMGFNAIFAFAIIKTMGCTWAQAMAAVMVASILFFLLSLSPFRAKMLKDIPMSLQLAVCGGVGILIASIGLINSGTVVVVGGLPTLGSFGEPKVQLVIIGLFVTATLLALKFRYAVLAGIMISTIIGVPLGVTVLPEGGQLFSLPPDPSQLFMNFDFSWWATPDFFSVVIVFLFLAIFDSLAAFLGLFSIMGEAEAVKYRHKMGPAFVGDSLAMIISSMLGVTPNTAFGESGTGIAMGGRTGLTSVVCAMCFVLALFCAPIFLSIPLAAVAPALMVVGLYMLSTLTEVDFKDFTEAFPAVITVILIGLSWKISDSLAIAWLIYILMKIVAGRQRELNLTIYVVGFIFAFKLGWAIFS